jgi:hypothetical protein
VNSALDASVTLEDVLAVVQTRRVPLAPELAGYLALEIAEASASWASAVEQRLVYISEEGSVALVRQRGGGPRAEDERRGPPSVRVILGEMLAAGGGSTPALSAVARKNDPDGDGLALAQELEAALIPVNRSAGRRALARLARDVKRVMNKVGRNAEATSVASRREPSRDDFDRRESEVPPAVAPALDREKEREDAPPAAEPASVGRSAPAPARVAAPTIPKESADDLLANFAVSGGSSNDDNLRELKRMAGMTPTPPPPGTRPANDDGDGEDDASRAETRVAAPVARRDDGGASEGPASRRRGRDDDDDRSDDERRAKKRAGVFSSRLSEEEDERSAPKLSAPRKGEYEPARAPKTRLALVAILAFLLLAATFAVWRFKPGFFGGHTADVMAEERAKWDREKRADGGGEVARCRATLVVTDVPEGAEVLLNVGKAPTDVDRMPVGTRLEFVATAEGYAPRRTVVPAGASWDVADGRSRFELAVQLEASRAAGGADAWPQAEPGSEVGGRGAPGTVHIVAQPKGAELWLLAGVAPEATLDAIPCDADVDVLVAGPTTFRKRLRAPGKSFVVKSPGLRELRLSTTH